MKKINKAILPAALIIMLFSACTKMKDVGILNTGGYTDTATTLKSVGNGGFIGVAIDYPAMITNSSYSAVVNRDFSQVTFGNLMKHSSIVKDNGTMDFTNTDALVAAVGSLDIFGHTLGWHSQQTPLISKAIQVWLYRRQLKIYLIPGLKQEVWQTGLYLTAMELLLRLPLQQVNLEQVPLQ